MISVAKDGQCILSAQKPLDVVGKARKMVFRRLPSNDQGDRLMETGYSKRNLFSIVSTHATTVVFLNWAQLSACCGDKLCVGKFDQRLVNHAKRIRRGT